ncbi:SDR family NAD(P)-dependent oxidoreductase [Thioclava sp. GXIMD4216]|uniref:SDR family NAD(P)-dependent oxidoreductase n=1 Tax=Thioclava litoralis TaxID=3076557 RepID=A0ABZ1E2F7_9RHOB|nr:SDR family NAD(P)-dependent oxidoreductase [Thioclava sp. FTW29]
MRALIIGDTGGIGEALRDRLERGGHEVLGLSRARDGFDISEEAKIEAVISGLDGTFDMVVIASGILGTPEKSLATLKADEMMRLFAVNAMGPALVMKHVTRLLPKDSRAHLAVLSARVGSIGDNYLGGWYSYRASKAALNQLVRTASIELRRKFPELVVAALHPGTVATAFTSNYTMDKVSPDEAAERLLSVLQGLTPEQSGGFWDYSGKSVEW